MAAAPTEFQLRRISYYLRERPNDPALQGYLEELGFDGDTWEQLRNPTTRQSAIQAIGENMAKLVYDAVKDDDATRVVDLYDAALPVYEDEYNIIRMSLGEGGVLKGSPKTFNAMAALVDADDLQEFLFRLFQDAHINANTALNVLRQADYSRLNEIVSTIVAEELDRFKRIDDNYLLELLRPENLEMLRQYGINLTKIRTELERFYARYYSEDDGPEYEEAKRELAAVLETLKD